MESTWKKLFNFERSIFDIQMPKKRVLVSKKIAAQFFAHCVFSTTTAFNLTLT
jgi:hypothetical protein